MRTGQTKQYIAQIILNNQGDVREAVSWDVMPCGCAASVSIIQECRRYLRNASYDLPDYKAPQLRKHYFPLTVLVSYLWNTHPWIHLKTGILYITLNYKIINMSVDMITIWRHMYHHFDGSCCFLPRGKRFVDLPSHSSLSYAMVS
jgi:hypothetical protein